MSEIPEEKTLLSVKDVARLTGLSEGYLRILLKEGEDNPGDPTKLHGFKPGGRDWVVERSEFERFQKLRRGT